jgi:hypothetical protein
MAEKIDPVKNGPVSIPEPKWAVKNPGSVVPICIKLR